MNTWQDQNCCESSPVFIYPIETIIPIYDLTPSSLPSDIQIFIPGPAGPPGPGAQFKKGVISSAGFTGTPRKATVVFSTPFLDATYTILITGQDARIFTYESKTANGFTINTNANGALLGEVSWFTS